MYAQTSREYIYEKDEYGFNIKIGYAEWDYSLTQKNVFMYDEYGFAVKVGYWKKRFDYWEYYEYDQYGFPVLKKTIKSTYY